MVLPWKQLLKAMNSIGGCFSPECEVLWNFLANLIVASFASVPEFVKKTRSAKEEAVRRFASSTWKSFLVTLRGIYVLEKPVQSFI